MQWPNGFDFYEFGKILPNQEFQTLEEIPAIPEGIPIVIRMFDFEQDRPRLLIVIAPPEQDLSMYMEISNILAARAADKDDLFISAPMISRKDWVQKVVDHSQSVSAKQYDHEDQDQKITFLALWITGTSIGVGNA